MDLINIHTLISAITIIIAVISFFNSRTKDRSEQIAAQTNLDKQQDIDLRLLQEKHAVLVERVARIESSQEVLDGKLSKEVEKLYDKMSDFEKTVRHEISSLTQAIIKSHSKT